MPVCMVSPCLAVRVLLTVFNHLISQPVRNTRGYPLVLLLSFAVILSL